MIAELFKKKKSDNPYNELVRNSFPSSERKSGAWIYRFLKTIYSTPRNS